MEKMIYIDVCKIRYHAFIYAEDVAFALGTIWLASFMTGRFY